MQQAFPEQHHKIVVAITAAAARLPKALRSTLPSTLSRVFLRAYYANVEVEDLEAREPKELATIALSHLTFARRRRGRALVRVFNPTMREHGYVSAHTIVEMVNDDMPFLVDSIGLALTKRSLTLHFLTHPVFAVARDGSGVLKSVLERGQADAGQKQRLESFQHIEVDRIVDPESLSALQSEIERSLRDVRIVYADWGKMRGAVRQVADDLNALNSRFDPRDVLETQALLAWIESRHFMFLGYREYRLCGSGGKESLQPVEGTGLGILRDGHKHPESTNRVRASDIRRQSRSRVLASHRGKRQEGQEDRNPPSLAEGEEETWGC